MIKIFKLIIAVALATIVGIWASSYHGYIMLVLADKTIKMNFVIFVFILIAAIFILLFGIRVAKLMFNLPYAVFSWLIGLFKVNKQEKFIDLFADISLDNNKIIDRLSIGYILKLTPDYLKEYVLYRKLSIIACQGDVKDLEKALKQIDTNTQVYKYFEVYRLYFVQKFAAAQAKVLILLEKNDSRFIRNIVNLAGRIALAEGDDSFALRLLEKYDSHLEEALEEELIILALRKASDIDKLTDIYSKADATENLTRVYLEQLVELDQMQLANKIAKKQLAKGNILPGMLKLYVNAFNMPISRLSEKVLDSSNKNYESVLTLLDLAMVKSDTYSFKIIYNYIEREAKEFFSDLELARYLHILCKFYIKNGEVAGIDLSEARLVYRSI